MTSDNIRINKVKSDDSGLTATMLDDFAMKPIAKNSLIIQNGVIYIIGGVSSGKSTLISRLMKIYNETISPTILFIYSGFSPDETTTLNTSSMGISNLHFIQLSTPQAFTLFFDQFRSKKLKLSELFLFVKSVFSKRFDDDAGADFADIMRMTVELYAETEQSDDPNRLKVLKSLITTAGINLKKLHKKIYWSDYVMKQYAQAHNLNFNIDPVGFIARALISLSKGLSNVEIMIPESSGGFKRLSLPPFIRFEKQSFAIVPSLTVFDDVAQFPLLTTERASQWVKDLFAEVRRFRNTFIIASQRYNLLNKSLRALTHTFFIGYSLIDDDLPKVSKEMPSNILSSSEFIEIYKTIKPFTFFVYNNRFGFNIIKLER